MNPLLLVDHAHVRFGGLQAVAGVSIRADQGSIVGLIGPNGAGKTTLLNAIGGTQRLDAGRVLFEGSDITKLRADQRAALGIGRSFQNLGLMMDESVQTNVVAATFLRAGYSGADLLVRPRRWRARERDLRDQARHAMAAFGILAANEQIVADLSFAMARFVELAAVVAMEPKLLLLDEPTTGLDVAEIEVLTRVLRGLRDEGRTIVVIAHDVQFVMELCDHVYALASGRILAEGVPDDVRNDPRVVEAWVGAA